MPVHIQETDNTSRGTVLENALYVNTTSNPAVSIDTGGANIDGLAVGDINGGGNGIYFYKSGLVGDDIPAYTFLLTTYDNGWPSFFMEGYDSDFEIKFDGGGAGIGGWVIEAGDTIRMQPANEIFQVQGKFQIGQSFASKIGGNSGFVEWFHDGTDGFITSSGGKIFIPRLNIGGQSLKILGDSTTELDVRRTISDLDNTNVTGAGTVQVGGDFDNASDLSYKIEITTGGEIGVAKYRWSDDGGSSWDESNITTAISPRNMNNGLKVWFVGNTGTDFNTNDYATVTAIGTDNQKRTLVVDTTNNKVGIGTSSPNDELHVVGGIDLVHVAVSDDEHALEIDVDAAGRGDIKAIDVNYDTGTISSGEDEAVVLVDINEIDATGGDVFGLEVLATDGGADNIFAMKAGAEVGVILQESGTFANPTTATNDTTSSQVGEMKDGSTETNTTIFVVDDDYILIGAAAAFTEIEFIIETPASNPGIRPTFGYSTTGSHQFTPFSPIDGTNGFRNTGVIAWDAADLTSHAVNSDTGTFDIKIIRTHAVAGSVSLFYAKTASTVVYSWDKDGNISVKGITANGNIISDTDSADDLGSATNFWDETFTDELILTNVGAASAVANRLVLSAVDLSAGNTMLAINTEGTDVVGTGTPTADRTIAIEINGTTYYIITSTSAS